MKNVLVIEDDKLISSLVTFKLKKDGFNVITVGEGEEGMVAIENVHHDLIITDVMSLVNTGLDFISHSKKVNPQVPVLVLNSLDDELNVMMEAFQSGATDFMPKPFHPKELTLRVQKLTTIN
jgi:two-component system, OmpR family, response regulator VicR